MECERAARLGVDLMTLKKAELRTWCVDNMIPQGRAKRGRAG